MVHGTDSDQLRPDLVRTRVTLREGIDGEVLGTQAFDDPVGGCAPAKYPSSSAIGGWIREQLPEVPRRRRRR